MVSKKIRKERKKKDTSISVSGTKWSQRRKEKKERRKTRVSLSPKHSGLWSLRRKEKKEIRKTRVSMSPEQSGRLSREVAGNFARRGKYKMQMLDMG